MKKMMTAFAVCMIAGLVSAQVESLNIVGYQTLTAPGQFYSSGSTFISVGSATGEWQLGDVAATGMDPTQDNIQFLSTATAFPEVTATYIDSVMSIALVGDESLVGWWNLDIDTPLDDLTFGAGTGFLCNFASSGVALTYAGEVLTSETSTLSLDLSGMQFPMIANFTPVDLTLGDLTVSGMDPTQDNIQFLDPATALPTVTATYIDSAMSIALVGDESLVGWWNLDIDTSLNDTALPAGSAVLGNFASSGVVISFPDPVPAT